MTPGRVRRRARPGGAGDELGGEVVWTEGWGGGSVRLEGWGGGSVRLEGW